MDPVRLQGEIGCHSRARISPYDTKHRRFTVFANVSFDEDSKLELSYWRRYILAPYSRVYDDFNRDTPHVVDVLSGQLDLFIP